MTLVLLFHCSMLVQCTIKVLLWNILTILRVLDTTLSFTNISVSTISRHSQILVLHNWLSNIVGLMVISVNNISSTYQLITNYTKVIATLN